MAKIAARHTRTAEVMEAVRRQIASRALATGEKLPSIRGMATRMGVAASTVAEAYDRLVAEGVIRSRPGSGFYVLAATPPLALTEAGPQLDREIDPFWVSRQSLDARPDVLKPGCGWLPPDWMPNEALRRALRRLARADAATLSDYGSTRGAFDLRRMLVRQFAEEGLDVVPEQVMLTGSGTQAIDLICRYLLTPDDTVLVDDPCYFNFQALLRAHRVRVVGVPHTATGPDVAQFAQALAAHKPRLYITNSGLHNPTGASLSPRTAHRLLTEAARHDLLIVEDDIFAGFEPEPSPRLAALDGLDRVIRIGSFSKTLSASIRCGYILARPDRVEALVDLQVATHFGGVGPMAAELVHSILNDSGYRRHMETTRRRLATARQKTAARLGRLGIEPWLMPRGGFYLWCRLPDGQDAAPVARAALAENVILAPGNVFSVSQSTPDFMRFNVSQTSDPAIYDVLARALEAGRD